MKTYWKIIIFSFIAFLFGAILMSSYYESEIKYYVDVNRDLCNLVNDGADLTNSCFDLIEDSTGEVFTKLNYINCSND